MTEPKKQIERSQAIQRELWTLGGFVALVLGLCLQFGVGVAMITGGGLIFAAGMYGILKR